MNKFPFIMIIVAGLFSCNNNHSSCPIITADFTTDSLIDTNLVLEAPVLPKEYRESIVGLSKKCRNGFVYEAELSCRLITDTTYFLGFIRNTESQMHCEITDIHLLRRINRSGIPIDTTGIDGRNEAYGYFVLFPEGVGCSYPWAAYVSDKTDSVKIQPYDSILHTTGIPIFCYDISWHYSEPSH